MESLVEKWKNTLSTKNFTNSLRESQSMVKKTLQSSNEKPPIKPSVGLPSSIRKPLNRDSSSSSSDDLSMEMLKPAHKGKKPQNSAANSAKKPIERTPKKPENKEFIKENVYLILDLFEREIPLKERISGIKHILEKVHLEGKKSSNDEGNDKFNESLKESKASFFNKIEGSSKMLSELESRLFQSEKEKLQLKSEKEQLHFKLNKSEEELQLRKINFEMIERLQESHKLLERNNKSLLQELESANQRLYDQQKLFESQVNDLTQLFEKIKGQSNHEE